MKNNLLIELIIGSIFVFLFIVYFADFFSYQKYTIIRKRLPFKEPFITLAPADINASYSLLNGVLPLKENVVRGGFNSQSCFEQNFQSRLEKTGNYIQRTNNYKHEDPESCSSPFQEFVGAYYKVEPLPKA
jgi:hypothetical protein